MATKRMSASREEVKERGKHTQPVVYPKIWNTVPNKQVEPAKIAAYRIQCGAGNCNTKIREQDEFRILGFIQRTVWIEVVDTSKRSILFTLASTFLLKFMVVVASHVGQDIRRPTTELLNHKIKQSCNWCLFSQFVEFMSKLANSAGVYISCFGDENHVSLHITSCLVVFAMRDLP